MRRSVLLVSLFTSVALPVIALAAYALPSELLMSSGLDGRPRDFSAKVYVEAGADDAAVHITGSIKGKSEGTNAKDIKAEMHITASMENDQGNGSVVLNVKAAQGTLAVQVEELRFETAFFTEEDRAQFEEQLSAFRGKWYTVALADLPEQAPTLDAVFEQYAGMLQDAGVSVTAGDLKAFAADLINAAFRMERTQYLAGNAYDLRLRPDAAKALMNVLNRWATNMDPSFLTDTSLDDSSSAELQQLLDESLNVHMKIDTNTAGEFRFGKYYVGFQMPEAELTFAVEGTLQHRVAAVNVDLPNVASPLEFLTEDILGELDDFFPSGDDMEWENQEWETLPPQDWEWDEEEWLPLPPDDWQSDDERRPPSVRPPRLPQNPPYLPDDTLDLLRATCGTPTGAPEQSLQYARKGTCGVKPLSRRHLRE